MATQSKEYIICVLKLAVAADNTYLLLSYTNAVLIKIILGKKSKGLMSNFDNKPKLMPWTLEMM